MVNACEPGINRSLLLLLIFLAASAPVAGGDFLWEFRGPEGSGYLMGSIHLLKAEYYPLSVTVMNAFRNSRILAVEADISPEKMGEAALMQMKRGLYPEGDCLRNHVTEETYAMARARLDKLGMDISGFKRFKPWMLALTLVSMEMMRMGFDPAYGVDRHFLQKADKDMEIRELEGLARQMDLFDGFSDELNDRFLFYNIQEAGRSSLEVEAMVDAWRQGDAARMENLVTESVKRFPDLAELYRVVIHERNQSMMDSIIGMLDRKKRVFVVVGAAHLVGSKGIVALMKKRGFRLRQL